MSDARDILEKWARLEIYLYRLRKARLVATHDEALALLASTLHGVEDEYSGVPYDPAETGSDGRMYPPKATFRKTSRELPGVRAYRQFAHITFVADNGAFEIREIDRSGEEPIEYTVIDKPGLNGKRIEDYGKS